MKDKIKLNPQQEEKYYQELLDLSSHHLKPSVKAQLNENRRLAVDQLDNKSMFKSALLQPATALLIPVLLIVGLLFSTPDEVNLQVTDTDIYSVLELLEDEEQLEFLAEFDVSQWLIDEGES